MANTVNIKGVKVPVIEHFKEIKECCENSHLFRRWYNRQQFLSAIIGALDDFYPQQLNNEFGTIIGGFSGENIHECWTISVYDTEAMTVDQLQTACEQTGGFAPGFFLQDKTDKIYFVFTETA